MGKFKSGGFAEYEIQNGIGENNSISNKKFILIVITLIVAIIAVVSFSVFSLFNNQSVSATPDEVPTESETTVTYDPYDIFDFENKKDTAPAYATPIIKQPTTSATEKATQPTTQPTTARPTTSTSSSASSRNENNSNTSNNSNNSSNRNNYSSSSSSSRPQQSVVNSETKKPQKINVTKVTLNNSSKTLYEGTSFNLKATVSPSNATDKTVYWTTSNKSVATVSNGTVKGIKSGTAVITARAGNKTASCTVTVTKKPESSSKPDTSDIYIFPSERTIAVGSKITIKLSDNPYSKCVWSFSNPTVAKMARAYSESEIIIEGLKKGVTNVIATLEDGSTYKAKITVV